VLGITPTLSTPTKDSVVVYKAGANQLGISGYGAPSTVKALLFTIWTPAPLTLTAQDFNTLLNTQPNAKSQKLSFFLNKTHEKNPWTDQALTARDTISTSYGSGNWLNFSKPTSNGEFDWGKALRVDTSYVNRDGVKFLDFEFDSIVHNNTTRYIDLPGQYAFQVEYHISNDSAVIYVATARDTVGIDAISAESSWAYNLSDIRVTHFDWIVKLQDLVSDHSVRIITVGPKPANTKIELGLKGCTEAPTTTLTSIDEDVYIIHNAAGEVLGVPIYTDSATTNKGVQWLKYSAANVDPKFIPAYQWVVKQRRTTSPDYSPIKLTNREFPDVIWTTLQLDTKNAADLFGEGVFKANFTPVPKAQKEDPYLGYYYITEQEAKLNSYDLNYYHNLSSELYLGKSDVDGDSTLLVKKQKTQYKFVPVSKEFNYGYSVATSETIKDLVQLKRVAYVLSVGGKYLTINENERYSLTTDPSSYNGDSAAFLLKTNNTVGNKHYYALLDTLAYPFVPYSQPNTYKKVGISDDNLWAFAQVQKETRTSAFNPSVYSSPLYRRFDNGDYTYGNGQETVTEPYGAADNAPVWLQFTRANNFGVDLLFENSPVGEGLGEGKGNQYRQGLVNKQISFLGEYNKLQYPETDNFKYTFYVDTAYTARPAAASSTTSTYTAKPQYMLAVRPDIRQADTIYRLDNGWWENAAGDRIYPEDEYSNKTEIVRPALTRGYYLFNAADSVTVRNKDYEGKAAYGAEGDVRLAFVDGIHLADTFYVIPAELKAKYTTGALQEKYRELLWTLNPIYKHYLGDNDHFAPRFAASSTAKNHVYNYVGTGANRKYVNGKSMVFQFRLLTNEANPNRNFLIETTTEDNTQMGPDLAKWVKINNHVPVISNAIEFYAASRSNNGAEIFNVLEGTEKGATSNEAAPAVSEVKVISEVGAVTILNAAGKQVAISNILGQTVAGSVLSSDNARITLPKGIVIVSVEGEAAVKAVVK
jgi:hypothetical protein